MGCKLQSVFISDVAYFESKNAVRVPPLRSSLADLFNPEQEDGQLQSPSSGSASSRSSNGIISGSVSDTMLGHTLSASDNGPISPKEYAPPSDIPIDPRFVFISEAPPQGQRRGESDLDEYRSGSESDLSYSESGNEGSCHECCGCRPSSEEMQCGCSPMMTKNELLGKLRELIVRVRQIEEKEEFVNGWCKDNSVALQQSKYFIRILY